MAEEKYAIPASPQYSENIRKLQDTDPADACQIFNPLFSRLIENTASVKRQADETAAAASSIITLGLTVPSEGWRTVPGEPGEPPGLCVDIPVEGVQEDLTPILVILPACLGTAGACGLSSTVRTLDGLLRVYANRTPSAPMEASLILVRLSVYLSGSRIAADSELKEMLDEVFRGIPPTPAGAGIRIAGDSEVADILDETFGKEGQSDGIWPD